MTPGLCKSRPGSCRIRAGFLSHRGGTATRLQQRNAMKGKGITCPRLVAAVGNTVNKTRRGAWADARARPEGKETAAPWAALSGPSDGVGKRSLPCDIAENNIDTVRASGGQGAGSCLFRPMILENPGGC